MKYNIIQNKKNKFEVIFLDFFGSGWHKKVYDVIAIYIFPEVLSINFNSFSLNSSKIEINFTKYKINAIIAFDEYDTVSLISNDDKCTLEIFESWAKIITEKLGNESN